MKKLTIFIVLFGMATTSFSQNASEKKFLAGLTVGGAISFNTAETQTIETKIGGDFILGTMLDWNFSKNIGLTTGLEFEFDKFTTKYNDLVYYGYNDKEILRMKDSYSSDDLTFLVNERKHNNIYMTLPIMVKFQTNYLGYFRYFGRFGMRNSIILMSRMDDSGRNVEAIDVFGENKTLKDMRSKGFMSFYKGSVGISAGAEYNITGSTTLVAELGYYYGFSELFNQSEKQNSLYKLDVVENEDDGTIHIDQTYYSPKLRQGLLALKVSVLF